MSEVKQYNRAPSFTTIPPSLARWAVSREFRLSWQQRSSEQLSMVMGLGVMPVTKDMLQKVNLKQGEKTIPLLKKLETETACMWTDEGYLQRFDAILCYQPVEQHNERVAVEDELRVDQESGSRHAEALAAEMERAVQRTGVSTSGPVLRSHQIPDARDGVGVHIKE